jgi:hypothetical protein
MSEPPNPFMIRQNSLRVGIMAFTIVPPSSIQKLWWLMAARPAARAASARRRLRAMGGMAVFRCFGCRCAARCFGCGFAALCFGYASRPVFQ